MQPGNRTYPGFMSPAVGLLVSQWLWFLLGLSLTITAIWIVWRGEVNRIQVRFDQVVAEEVLAWRRTVDASESVLQSLAAYMESSEQVTRDEFSHFATHLLRTHGYVSGLAFAPVVTRAEADAFVAEVRERMDPEFRLRTEADHSVLTPVLLWEGKASAIGIGVDLWADPTLRAALQGAATTGEVVSTGKVQLVSGQEGYLLVRPVYHFDNTSGQAPKALRGYALAVFRIGDLVVETFGDVTHKGLALELFDGETSIPAQRLFGSVQPPRVWLQKEMTLTVGSRPMLAVWTVGSDFAGGVAIWRVLLTATGGLLVTLLFVLWLHSLQVRAQLVERTVSERTRELNQAHAALNAAHEELQQWTKSLEHRVDERTRDVRRLATVFAHAPDPIIIEDLNRTVTDVNPAAERLFGWRWRELVGQSITLLIPPEEQEESLKRIQQVLSGTEVRDVEVRRVTKEGRQRSLLVSKTLLGDDSGQPFGVVSLFKDISDLKATQERLQTSLDQLRVVSAAGRAILPTTTRQQVLETVAEALAGRFGYDTAAVFEVNGATETVDLVSVRGTLAGQVPAGTRIAFGNGMTGQVAVDGEARYASDLQSGGNAGLTPEVRSQVDVPVSVKGKVVGVLTAMSRIPGAFEVEHLSALEAIAGRVAVGLDRAELYEEIQAKNDEMETFLHATSHDLRSPLVNIQGFSEELESACQDVRRWAEALDLPEDQKAPFEEIWSGDIAPSLRFIGASVRKMEALVNGLLQLSRIGRLPLAYGKVSVSPLVQEIVDSMQSEITAADVTVHIGALPPVDGDRDGLSQVFSNLIQNAVKYRDPDRPAEIRIAGEVNAGWCRYCVQDNGIGIAPEHHDQIFRPFHRLNPKDSTGANSHGLGLSIVDRVVRRHGGRLRLESEPGVGSRFWVELPERREPQSR